MRSEEYMWQREFSFDASAGKSRSMFVIHLFDQEQAEQEIIRCRAAIDAADAIYQHDTYRIARDATRNEAHRATRAEHASIAGAIGS